MSQHSWTVDWFAKYAWINSARKEDFSLETIIDVRVVPFDFSSLPENYDVVFLSACENGSFPFSISPNILLEFASLSIAITNADGNKVDSSISFPVSFRVMYTRCPLRYLHTTNSIAYSCSRRINARWRSWNKRRICEARSLQTGYSSDTSGLSCRQRSL